LIILRITEMSFIGGRRRRRIRRRKGRRRRLKE
jgi:hypothetical protein